MFFELIRWGAKPFHHTHKFHFTNQDTYRMLCLSMIPHRSMILIQFTRFSAVSKIFIESTGKKWLKLIILAKNWFYDLRTLPPSRKNKKIVHLWSIFNQFLAILTDFMSQIKMEFINYSNFDGLSLEYRFICNFSTHF